MRACSRAPAPSAGRPRPASRAPCPRSSTGTGRSSPGAGLAAVDLASGRVLWSDASGAETTAPPGGRRLAPPRRREADGTLRCRDRATGRLARGRSARRGALARPAARGRGAPPPLPRHDRQAHPRGLARRRARAAGRWRVGADIGHAGPPAARAASSSRPTTPCSTRCAGAATSPGAAPLPSRPLSAPLLVGGHVLVACLENELVAFAPDTGARAGGLRTSAEIRTPPLVAGGYVVVGPPRPLRDRLRAAGGAVAAGRRPRPRAAGCPPSARPIDCPHAHELSHGPARPGPTPADWLELAKPRITAMVVFTALVGFVTASTASPWTARPGRRARRHRPRRRGRQRPQPGDGARHGRAHAAHARRARIPSGRILPARGPGLRRRCSPPPGSPCSSWLCGPLAGGGGPRDLGELPLRLHAPQAAHAARDARRAPCPAPCRP